jgi:DNA-binding NarL/FixJ family response regulator
VADRIRVLIVDDHAMVRRGMRDFLDLLTSRTQAALFAVEHRLDRGS